MTPVGTAVGTAVGTRASVATSPQGVGTEGVDMQALSTKTVCVFGRDVHGTIDIEMGHVVGPHAAVRFVDFSGTDFRVSARVAGLMSFETQSAPLSIHSTIWLAEFLAEEGITISPRGHLIVRATRGGRLLTADEVFDVVESTCTPGQITAAVAAARHR